MINFTITDESGTIRCYGFEEALDTFYTTLENGKTYIAVRVLPKKREDGSFEIQIFKESGINKSVPLVLKRTFITVSDALETKGGTTVAIKGVLHELECTPTTMKNGVDKISGILVDETGQIPVNFTGKIVGTPPEKGVALEMQGRMSDQKHLFVTCQPVEVKDDNKLASWYKETPPVKRQKVEVLNLGHIKDVNFGSICTIRGIVSSFGTNVVTLPNGGEKRNLTIVDKSMMSIDVSVFDAGSKLVAEIGDVIEFDGMLVSFNTRSFSTKNFNVVPDKSLTEWFFENAEAEFDEISFYVPAPTE